MSSPTKPTLDLSSLLPPNGTGEKPAEPFPTPAVQDPKMSTKVNEDAVDEKLEAVREEGEQ